MRVESWNVESWNNVVGNSGWDMIFDGWAPVVRTLVLGVLGYVTLIVLLRGSGKRTLSKMNAFDFVVTVALGSTLATLLTSRDVSLAQGSTALGLLVLLQLMLTFLAVRFPRCQKIIKAQPTLIFFRGEFLLDALLSQRITEEEIVAAMRQQGVTKPESVDAVILETEGSLSVLTDSASSADALAELGVAVDAELGRRRGVKSMARHTSK